MMQWDRLTLGRMAKELGFPRDTLEKVCRLADVLKFMESDELLSEGIALKGGTAINLTIFDLPRLSVDIDLDYCRSIGREEMLADTDSDNLLDNEELSSVIPVKKINIMDCFRLTGIPVKIQDKYIDVYDYYSNPTKEDTDGDGLFDGKAVVIEGKTAIPKDQEPKIKNGIDGIWTKQVEQLLKLKDTANYHETEIRNIALLIKKYCNGEMATIAGAFLLNFVQDTDGQAYHSQPNTWQRYFGYNDLYDDVFRIGSYMHYLPIDFSTPDEKYRLWMWKGDYWNLHSGAEIGLYCSPESYSGNDHYDVIDFEVPMTLSLYSYNSNTDIDTIFAWAPDEPQWWVTGFSGQNPEFLYPDENKMVAVGSIDLSGYTDIYEGLKKEKYDENGSEKKRLINRYLVFDDTSSTVWVC